jgi:hypothetical protein
VHAIFIQEAISEDLIRVASQRQFALAMALVVETALMFALSIAELPVFDLTSQILFLGIEIIGVESLLVITLALMIVNSWWSSYLMASRNDDFLLKKEANSNGEHAVPLRYME